jgi:hypothetical protein
MEMALAIPRLIIVMVLVAAEAVVVDLTARGVIIR